MKHLKKCLAVFLFCTIFVTQTSGKALAENEDVETMQKYVTLIRDFLGVMDQMYQIANSRERSAIYQLHEIEEAYKDSGDRLKSVKVYRDVLSKETNPTIRAAASVMLGTVLKESGKPDQAIEVLQQGLEENLKAAN